MATKPIKLTETRKQDLIKMQPDIDNLKEELDRAESAGIDVTENRLKLSELEKQRDGILKVYG